MSNENGTPPSLGAAIRAAAERRAEAHEELVRLCRVALQRGASYREIEKYAGMSHMSIYRWTRQPPREPVNPLDQPE